MSDKDKKNNLKINVHDSIHLQETTNVNLEIKKIIKRTADVLEKTNEILTESNRTQRRHLLIATLIGSFLGFIFAILLFFITGYVERYIKEQAILQSLLHEQLYNQTVADFALQTISERKELIQTYFKRKVILPEITKDIKSLKIITDQFSDIFFKEAFENGVLLGKIHPVELIEWKRINSNNQHENDFLSETNNLLEKFSENDGYKDIALYKSVIESLDKAKGYYTSTKETILKNYKSIPIHKSDDYKK